MSILQVGVEWSVVYFFKTIKGDFLGEMLEGIVWGF